MPQTAEAPTAFSPSSFAGLLAALTTSGQKSGASGDASRGGLRDSKSATSWNDDILEDDVATISYEQALRAHTRIRPADPTDHSLTQPPTPGPIHTEQASPAEFPRTAPKANAKPFAPSGADAKPWPVHSSATPLEQNLKSASITIRLSQAECEQLRTRAAEAGLTVSAYLRSCTFEAESLRALVKDTLAQLNSAKKSNQVASAQARRSPFEWLSRFLPRWNLNQRTAQA